MKKLFCSVIVLYLGGCSAVGLYQWGGYEDNLYRYYDKPQSRQDVMQRLEAHAQSLESSSKIVPPGFYAELGTFYLELGDLQSAVAYYKKEAESWPESRAFMDALINNLDARTVKEEASDAS